MGRSSIRIVATTIISFILTVNSVYSQSGYDSLVNSVRVSDNLSALKELAIIDGMSGRDEALTRCQNGIERSRRESADRLEFELGLAIYYFNAGLKNKGREIFEKVSASEFIDETLPLYYYAKGLFSYSDGNRLEAIESFLRGRESKGEYYERGYCDLRLGRLFFEYRLYTLSAKYSESAKKNLFNLLTTVEKKELLSLLAKSAYKMKKYSEASDYLVNQKDEELLSLKAKIEYADGDYGEAYSIIKSILRRRKIETDYSELLGDFVKYALTGKSYQEVTDEVKGLLVGRSEYQADIYFRLGDLYNMQFRSDSSRKYYDMAIDSSKSETKVKRIKILLNSARLHSTEGEYGKEIVDLMNALKIAVITTEPELLAKCYKELSEVYLIINNRNKAFEYLKSYEKLNNDMLKAKLAETVKFENERNHARIEERESSLFANEVHLKKRVRVLTKQNEYLLYGLAGSGALVLILLLVLLRMRFKGRSDMRKARKEIEHFKRRAGSFYERS